MTEQQKDKSATAKAHKHLPPDNRDDYEINRAQRDLADKSDADRNRHSDEKQ